jgi:hypothetical protein
VALYSVSLQIFRFAKGLRISTVFKMHCVAISASGNIERDGRWPGRSK